MNKVLFSHKSDNWSTPDDIYSLFMSKGYNDPCPLNPNGFDAFFVEWPYKVYLNPPYSDIWRFVDYALALSEKNRKFDIWLLLPSRTGSKWFEVLVQANASLYFIRGRLKFGGSSSSAPFDSLLVHLDHFGVIDVIGNKDICMYLEDIL